MSSSIKKESKAVGLIASEPVSLAELVIGGKSICSEHWGYPPGLWSRVYTVLCFFLFNLK